jgi:hypothetical protein
MHDSQYNEITGICFDGPLTNFSLDMHNIKAFKFLG